MSLSLMQLAFMGGGGAANSYATWNPADKYSGISLSGGNLIATADATAQNESLRATLGKSSGKWYWEIVGANNVGVGYASASIAATAYPGSDNYGWGYNQTALKVTFGSGVGYGVTFSTTDVIGVALDMTAGTIEFSKNGASQGVAFSGLSGTLYPMVSVFAGSYSPCTANFGASALLYTPATFNAGLF